MGEAVKMSEALRKLLPRNEDVLVDETVLTLRAASIAQQAEVFDSMAGLDWAPVVAKLQPAFDRLKGLSGGDGFMDRLQGALPDLTRYGLQALGALVGTALAPAAAALLDTERNYRLMYPGPTQPAADYEGATYLRSADLRAWIGRNITAAQAVHVLTVAADLNGWREVAGKAMRALKAAPQGPINGKPVTIPTPEALNG